MNAVRRSLAWLAAEKYLSLAINFLLIVVISRLLTPREVGVSALGLAILSVAETLRDFGATTYLIQRSEATLGALRTTFTLLLIIATAIMAVMIGAAPYIAGAYSEPALASYIWILGASFAFGPFAGPLLGLMRREMQFERIAAIGVASSLVNAVLTVALALAGFSYMSFAWAGLAAALCTAVMALMFNPRFEIYRIGLHDWRDVVSFGATATATAVLNKAYEALPLLLLGRLLSIDAVGLFQRATAVCQLPDRFVTALIANISLPAFSAAARAGADMKTAFLRSAEHISAVQWPAYSMLAVLAYPIVRLILGPQWMAVAPLVQVMAIANLSMFAAVLSYPTFVAKGRIRDAMWSSLISLPLSIVFLVPAATWGLQALALSLLITLPLQVYVAIAFIRRSVPFTWRELALSQRKSALVNACTLIGPAVVVTLNGQGFDMSIWSAVIAGVLALPGWLGGLWISSHPLLEQLQAVAPGLNVFARRPATMPDDAADEPLPKAAVATGQAAAR